MKPEERVAAGEVGNRVYEEYCDAVVSRTMEPGQLGLSSRKLSNQGSRSLRSGVLPSSRKLGLNAADVMVER